MSFETLGGKSNNGWIYTDMSDINPESRSGHTATSLTGSDVVIMGGRTGDSKSMDHETIKPGLKLLPSIGIPSGGSSKSRGGRRSRSRSKSKGPRGVRSPERNRSPERPVSVKKRPPKEWRQGADGKQRLHKCPPRKYHLAIPDGEGGIFVHGGEGFAGNQETPYGDLWQWNSGEWRPIAGEFPLLSGHRSVVMDDKLISTGGFGEEFLANETVYSISKT